MGVKRLSNFDEGGNFMTFREEILKKTNTTDILQKRVDTLVENYYRRVVEKICNEIKKEIEKKVSAAEYKLVDSMHIVKGTFCSLYTGSYSFSKDEEDLIRIILNHRELIEKHPYITFDNYDGIYASIVSSVVIDTLSEKKVLFSKDVIIKERYRFEEGSCKLFDMIKKALKNEDIEANFKIRIRKDSYRDYMNDKFYPEEEYILNDNDIHEYRLAYKTSRFRANEIIEYSFSY